MSERSVVVRLRAEIGDFRRQMDQAAESAARTGRAAGAAGEQATTGMGRLVQSAHTHEKAWSTAGTSLLAFGGAAVAGVGLAIAKFAEFDKAMSEVKAATHASAGDMDQLREAAIKAGADTSYSAKEAADAITELSKAGVTTKDILNGGLNGALSLAAAGSLAVADAAELAATAMTQFKLQGSDLPHVADLLAAGAGKAQGSVEDMGMALKQGGLVAAATGLSIEETTGGLAAFASAGLVGSDAGTSFKTMLQSLTPSSKEAKEEMERLGISAYDSQGNFIGLSKFAGVLQTSMKGLTVEQRAASEKIIFGSDAVRAANVLYEQGAKGIQDWTNKVNDSGYAAVTASIKQDNLAGDLEKLGGSFDTVLIQGGSGAAQALRGVVQTAEDFIDSLGKMNPQLLGLGVTLAGVVGGSALLGGAFLKVVPAAIETVSAFRNLGTAGSRIPGTLGKITKAAGGVAIAFAGLQILGSIFTEKKSKSAEEYANAVLKVSSAGKAAKSSDLDSVFQGLDKAFGQDSVQNVNGMADAVARLSNHGWEKDVNQFFDGFTGIIGVKSDLGQLDDRLSKLGETLGTITSNGGAESAAKTFNLLSKEFENNGKSAQDALDKMPGYKDALLAMGQAAGVALQPNELLMLAAGRIPASMQAAQSATEQKTAADEAAAVADAEHAKALADIGLNADGTTASLAKLLDAMFAAGLVQLTANEASIKWQESLEGMDASIAKYGATLDITTEGGKANRRALDEMAQAGIANTKAMAENGASQSDLQKNLHGTYDSLIANYAKFGITGGAADTMARKVLGIPKNANINTAIQNYADSMAKLNGVGTKADQLNGKTSHVYIITHEDTIQTVSTSSASVHDNTGGRQGAKPTFHADGGAIHGPGSGTSDDVLTWLSNGEHVLTAAEVQKMGGQAEVYRFRALLDMGNIPKFATGGHIGESANARANRLYRERQAAATRRAAELRKSAAYRSEQLTGLGLDDARGQNYRTVDDSLSSAYSFSDRLRTVATSGNVPSQRAFLIGRANAGDEALRRLHARSDALGKSLDTAKQKLTDLTQVRGQVANALSGEFSLGKTVQRQGLFGAGAVANTIADAKGFLAKVQGFAGKLKRLQQKGFSGAILQEVAGLGTTAGTQAADSLLQASSAQVKDLNKTMTAIDSASLAAGNAVTDSMFKGGVNGAAAVVKGIESQQGAIGKAMLQIGLGMENALRSALGAKPIKRAGGGDLDTAPGPKGVDSQLFLGAKGEHVLTAQDVDAMGGQQAVYRFREQLHGHGAPSKALAGGYGQLHSIPAQAATGAGGSLDLQIDRLTAAISSQRPIQVNEQTNPVAAAMEISRRMGALRT